MKLPSPKPGLVIRYDSSGAKSPKKGREPAKYHPCVIVAAAQPPKENDIRVIIAPITSRPSANRASLKATPATCQQLGLKPGRQWLRFDELNRFTWPGYDLRVIPGRDRVHYGMLPRGLYEELRSRILERQKAGAGRTPLNRDEV